MDGVSNSAKLGKLKAEYVESTEFVKFSADQV